MSGDGEAPGVETPSANGPVVAKAATPPTVIKKTDDTSALQGFGILAAIGAVILGMTVFRDIVFAGRWTPWLYAGGLVALVGLAFLLPRGSQWVLENARRQGALLTFGVTPILLATVLAIVLASRCRP